MELPGAIREQLAGVVDSLRVRAAGQGLRFVPPENLHATIKFLGSVQDERAPDLAEVLLQASSDFDPVETGLSSLSAFSDPRRARVVIAKLADPTGALAELADRVETRTAALGFAPEGREHSPHVTLARLRMPRNLTQVLGSVPLEPTRFCFESLSLYRSETTPSGSRYHALATAKFGGRS